MTKWSCPNPVCKFHRLGLSVEVNVWPVECVCGVVQLSPDAAPIMPANKGQPPAMPSLARRAWNYTSAVARWKLAGSPTRSQAEVDKILADHCRRCDRYVDGKCRECGCPVNQKAGALQNKIAMQTEVCPLGKRGGDAIEVPIDTSGFRLATKQRIMGENMHRSGWPFAVEALQRIQTNGGILLDDFVEQTFGQDGNHPGYNQPWAGVFHYPPKMPEVAGVRDRIQTIAESAAFVRSLPHLKLAITLSEYLAEFLRGYLEIPVVAIKHPWRAAIMPWEPDSFSYRLVQIGTFLRNTSAIYQVFPPSIRWQMIHVTPRAGWAKGYHRRVAQMWQRKQTRKHYQGVRQVPFLCPLHYDRYLASSVVLIEAFDMSACNVLGECIAANTPVVINRQRAAVEYLGADYPFYFDSIEEVSGLLSDERIMAAHEYLKRLDKSWMTQQSFSAGVSKAIESIGA